MRFSRDRRGQSVVVGTVILFGFLILAMATYQVQFVPTENGEVEFEHSQQVESEFLDLRNAVLNTGQSDNSRLTSLTLGTRYPQRTFFLNPPSATGELSTSDQQTIRIESATVAEDGNVGLFWEDRNLTFPTKSVRYSPAYNEYQNPPDLVYEHSMVVAEFDGAALTRTGQTAITNDADRISLTLIDGTLSETGIDRREIDPEALSQNARSVTLEPDGGVVVITLPTAVPEGEKRDALASGWNETFESGVDRTVTATSEGIRIEIETNESVELRLAQVGLGSGTGVTDESDGYITKVSESNGEFVAEVRDQFNNPVDGATVEVYSNEADLTPDERVTDSEGRVRITDREQAILTINDAPPSAESTDVVSFEAQTSSEDTRVAFETLWANDQPAFQEATNSDADWKIGASGAGDLFAETIPPVDDGTIQFATNDTDIATVNSQATTNQDGVAQTTFQSVDIISNQTVSVFVWGGGSGDSIDIRVIADGESEPEPVTAFESTTITNLVANDAGQSQAFTFTLNGDLQDGEEVVIDLDAPYDARGGPNTKVVYPAGPASVSLGSGTAEVQRPNQQSADLVYTAGAGGDSAGTQVEISVTGIEVGDVANEEYSVGFEHTATGTTTEDPFGIAELSGDRTITTSRTSSAFSTGALTLQQQLSVGGNLDADGDLTLSYQSAVLGDARSDQTADIGQEVVVEGNVEAGEEVLVGYLADIQGSIDSGGLTTLGQETTVGGSVRSAGDVDLGYAGEIGGDILTDGSVVLAQNSIVGGSITSTGQVELRYAATVEEDVIVDSGSDITCGGQSTINGQPCDEYVNENY